MQIILSESAIQLEETYSNQGSFIPQRATDGSAGYDIRACIAHSLRLEAGKCLLIPLGFYVHIADQHVAGLILPRSGLGFNEGIVLGNSVGLIDSDYQNEWMCAVWNRNFKTDIIINPMQTIAQILFFPVVLPEFEVVTAFDQETERTGGFGSTDVVVVEDTVKPTKRVLGKK